MAKDALPADNVPIEELDSNGDVILVVTGESPQSTRKLLVSSKALALASPVFAALFSRKFSEGIKIIKSIRPEITLNDDYSDAMRIMLGVFHFRELEKVDAQMMAEIAVLYDKYDCAKALMPWIKIWSERIIASIKTANAHAYNLLLVAAHFFRDQELFSQVSLKILRDCTTHELNMIWNRSDELYSELPQAAKCMYKTVLICDAECLTLFCR